MKHINIPIFIPHLGCPHDCVFCNQRIISGKKNFNISSVEEEIEKVLKTSSLSDCNIEIAFFGGSFTGIDRSLMITLLDKAQKYVDSGLVGGIRMSTRPDYIDNEILDILDNYTISAIELGIQSMDDGVLERSQRGHDSKASKKACGMIKSRGYSLVGQMMIGLPGSDIQKEIETARILTELDINAARIYPTVVFKNTELDHMMENGEYKALSLEESIERSAAVAKVFIDNDIKILRIGLCSQDNLSEEETITGGDYSPAIGEMTESRIYLNLVNDELEKTDTNSIDYLIIECPKGCTSKIIGHKKANKQYIAERYGIKKIKVIENDDLAGYNILLKYN